MENLICLIYKKFNFRALYIAKNIKKCEIINCDVMQCYQGLDISTNKPTKEELETIKHHLVSNITTGEDYSCIEYAKDASKIITEINERGNLPILVGGSNLYIQATVFKDKKLKYDSYFIHISCKIEELELLLEKRIEKMIQVRFKTINDKRGMIEEFIDFKKSNDEGKFQIFQSIGYKEFQIYLDDPNEENLKESIRKLNINTRNYARKQMTWFKSTWASTESPLIPNHLFNFDFKDQKKNDVCLEIAICLFEDKKLSNELVKYRVEKPLFVKDTEFKEYFCEFCKKTLHGENENSVHLKSKIHYSNKKRIKKLRNDQNSGLEKTDGKLEKLEK